MNRRKHFNSKLEKGIINRTRNEFENDMPAGSNDSDIFEAVSGYMTGRLDLEDVKNDPALSSTRDIVKEMISDYNKNISGKKDNEKFIKDIFSGVKSENKLTDEIKFIKQEIDNKNLNLITSEWVKEWHEKKQKIGVPDPKTEEIRNFVNDAINSSVHEPVKIAADGRKNTSGRSLFARYASLSAAALIGVLLVVRTLLPSSNPEKLFNSFYKPFEAISPVTRSITNNESDIYSAAIASYKTGNYQKAAVVFAEELKKDPLAVSSRFFLGLSQLALKNYGQSIILLSEVANDSGEYSKEARWYLGLTYLKSGNEQKAAGCFEYLSKSNGFYRESSEKILRGLK